MCIFRVSKNDDEDDAGVACEYEYLMKLHNLPSTQASWERADFQVPHFLQAIQRYWQGW